MKINLVRYANSLDPLAPYLKDSEQFIEDLNNELFDYDIELVENAKDAIYTFAFIETGGSEQKFILDYEKLPQPVILLSNSKNNSLPACFEIKTFLASKDIDCVIVAFGDEKHIANTINNLSKILSAKHNLSKTRLGVIGKPSDWLIASKVDYDKAKKTFGVDLIDITTEELKEEISKGLLDKLPRREELNKKSFDDKVLLGALEIYSGLKRIIEKYNLRGFTLRCFDLLEEYKNTACLAFAILNEEGYIATCEGDVPALLTMTLVKEMAKQSSFQANPSKMDLNDTSIIFAHCTLPLNMCKKYELMTHFESGLGIGVRGHLDLSQVTVVKISPNLDDILCVTGEIKENMSLPNYCRTQIKVKFEKEELFEFFNINFGNHVIIAYGDLREEIVTFFRFFQEKK